MRFKKKRAGTYRKTLKCFPCLLIILNQPRDTTPSAAEEPSGREPRRGCHLVGSGHWGQGQESYLLRWCLGSLYIAQARISLFTLQLSQLPSDLKALGFLAHAVLVKLHHVLDGCCRLL